MRAAATNPRRHPGLSCPAARIPSPPKWRARARRARLAVGSRASSLMPACSSPTRPDGQVAQDGDGLNSPFAQSLLEHLGEPGLEINMLFRRVHDDVKARTTGHQEPLTYGALPAEALFFKASD
jgi:uncharacterized caspase-like protein